MIIQIFSHLIIFWSGISYAIEYVPADYSEYLGPNWRQELLERKKPVSTAVMNHVTWADTVVAIKYFKNCFVPRHDIKFIPFLGRVAQSFGGVLVERNASKDDRSLIVDALGNYQTKFEQG